MAQEGHVGTQGPPIEQRVLAHEAWLAPVRRDRPLGGQWAARGVLSGGLRLRSMTHRRPILFSAPPWDEAEMAGWAWA